MPTYKTYIIGQFVWGSSKTLDHMFNWTYDDASAYTEYDGGSVHIIKYRELFKQYGDKIGPRLTFTME